MRVECVRCMRREEMLAVCSVGRVGSERWVLFSRIRVYVKGVPLLCAWNPSILTVTARTSLLLSYDCPKLQQSPPPHEWSGFGRSVWHVLPCSRLAMRGVLRSREKL